MPFGAIERSGTSMVNVDINLYHGVWVYAEQREGKLMNVAINSSEKGASLQTQSARSFVPFWSAATATI
jgi:electron transfer flavoprotein alpha subunit